MVSTDAIRAMKTMAGCAEKRIALAQDSACVGGLVMVLSNSDSDVVQLAIETLLLLCDASENRATLATFMGMIQQLEALLARDAFNRKIMNLAEILYNKLTESEPCMPLKDSKNVQKSRRSSCAKANRSILGRSKTIILQLRGLHDKHDREVCMRLLLRVKGVISITFDLNKKRCILRVKQDVKPEVLIKAVAKSQTMAAQQVVKDDVGEEILLSFNTTMHDADKENSILPDYLPDDADYSPVVVDDKALARNKKDQKKSSSWFGAAANFLSNSLYW